MAWMRKTLVILVCVSAIFIVCLQFQIHPRAGHIRAADTLVYDRIRHRLSPAHWKRAHISKLQMLANEDLLQQDPAQFQVKSTKDHVITTLGNVTRLEASLTLLRNVTQYVHVTRQTGDEHLYKSRDAKTPEDPIRNLNYKVIKKNPHDRKSVRTDSETAHLLHQTAAKDDWEDMQPLYDAHTPDTPSLVAVDHRARIRHLQQMCSDASLFSDIDYNRGNLTDFFYTKEYNFAYCKVPKSASTFWMRMFMVLWKGDEYSRFMTRWTRADIHTRTHRLTVSPIKVMESKARVVIVSRNPYSRLFSAYIDKIYLPLFWFQSAQMEGARRLEPFFVNVTVYTRRPRVVRVVNPTSRLPVLGNSTKIKTLKIEPICADNVSFEQFLKFIISEANVKRALEPHWAPIMSLCRPCQFNMYKVVKQETFTEDVDHVLDAVGVGEWQYPSIKTMLHDSRAAATSVASIIGVVAKKSAQLSVKSCIHVKEIARRIWISFQIQGYISDTVPFPESKIENEPVQLKYTFQDLVLNAIAKKSLSPSQKEEQRHEHLVHAYGGVSKDTIKEIQRIYKHDFLLFDYPFDPPTSTRFIP